MSVSHFQTVDELHDLYPELELGGLGEFLDGGRDGLEEGSVLVLLLLYEVGEDGDDVLVAVVLAAAVVELGPLSGAGAGVVLHALVDVHEHLVEPVVCVVVVSLVIRSALLHEALVSVALLVHQVDGV